MSNPTQPTTEDRFRQQYETFICPTEGCESQIRGECLVSNIDRKTGVRTVKGICEHCGRMYQARYRLDAGGWTVLEPCHEVTDKRAIAGMRARVDHVRGNRRVEALSA